MALGCCRAKARPTALELTYVAGCRSGFSPDNPSLLETTMPSAITDIAPADSTAALAHFESAFRFETDCWDVNDAISNNRQDFVLVDVRSPDLYANGHALGAINIPHR